jgi:formamidopyrimidine-DNA glycosylase
VPELPEVETVRRGLEPLLVGRTLVAARSHPSAKFTPALDAVGHRVESVARRGKYLLIGLDGGRRLVVHLGMTGQLRVDAPTTVADPYDRAWWHLDDGRRFAFRDVRRFGRLAVVGRDLTALPTLAALGPEPFADTFTPEHLWRSLRRSRVRVKSQLLGQRVVAGVGNIYADEALWRAGIHPGTRLLSRAAATWLHRSIIDVLAEGIEHGGTTLRDYRTVEGGSGSNQHRLDCYGRAGLACRRCGRPLRRLVIDGRGTTWCGCCQRR